MRNLKSTLKLCLVVGPRNCCYLNMNRVIERAIRGGITSIQLRCKSSTPGQIAKMGESLLQKLPPGLPLIINNHVEVAKQLGVGVHIGQDDMPYCQARQVLGENSVIGLSIENEAQAISAIHLDADYFGVGPIFKTNSKKYAAPPMGVGKLKAITSILESRICIGIGGINHRNITSLSNAGLDGIAVISAITASHNPENAAMTLLDCWGKTHEEALQNGSYNCRF